MIDLHTHSLLSDGKLLPMELAKRYENKGYEVVALTDHVDYSNLQDVIRSTMEVSVEINTSDIGIKVIPGVEITHVPPDKIGPIVQEIRNTNIRLIVCHGETIVEPVAEGTNENAINAEVDILSHPGLINKEAVEMCVEKGVKLEISTRKGHSLTNGHVAQLGKEAGAEFVLNSDSHAPRDILAPSEFEKRGMGAGFSHLEVKEIISKEMEYTEKIL